MATRKNTAPAGAPSASPSPNQAAADAPDGMGALLARLLDIVSHLQCADRVLYDLQEVPEALQPACIVLHRATQDLARLHADLDEWDATHETPAGEGVRS